MPQKAVKILKQAQARAFKITKDQTFLSASGKDGSAANTTTHSFCLLGGRSQTTGPKGGVLRALFGHCLKAHRRTPCKTAESSCPSTSHNSGTDPLSPTSGTQTSNIATNHRSAAPDRPPHIPSTADSCRTAPVWGCVTQRNWGLGATWAPPAATAVRPRDPGWGAGMSSTRRKSRPSGNFRLKKLGNFCFEGPQPCTQRRHRHRRT